MLIVNVGETHLDTLVGKGPEEESPTCRGWCVGWAVRTVSLFSPCGPHGAGLKPSPHGNPSDLLMVGITAAGLFNGFCFLMFTPLMTTFQILLPSLLAWTSLGIFTSPVNPRFLYPAGYLNSNWNISPYIWGSKCLFPLWTRNAIFNHAGVRWRVAFPRQEEEMF